MADKKRFTKYEKARIIGARALQISQGVKILIELNEEDLKALRYDPVAIANKEFEKDLIPIDVIRKLPEPRIEEDDE